MKAVLLLATSRRITVAPILPSATETHPSKEGDNISRLHHMQKGQNRWSRTSWLRESRGALHEYHLLQVDQLGIIKF